MNIDITSRTQVTARNSPPALALPLRSPAGRPNPGRLRSVQTEGGASGSHLGAVLARCWSDTRPRLPKDFGTTTAEPHGAEPGGRRGRLGETGRGSGPAFLDLQITRDIQRRLLYAVVLCTLEVQVHQTGPPSACWRRLDWQFHAVLWFTVACSDLHRHAGILAAQPLLISERLRQTL